MAQFFKVADVKLSYEDTGAAPGAPIVFIHAFPLNQTMWQEQVAALRAHHRVITFDVRGLGQSEFKAPYTLEFLVDDLIALLDHLKIEKAVVAGLSMGGYVALRAVERNPERFLGLVLANTKAEADSDAAKLGRYRSLKTLQTEGLASFAPGFLKGALAATPAPAVFARARKIIESSDPAGVCAALVAILSRTDTSSSLEKIRVPTLVLHGEADSVISLSAAEFLYKKIAGSEFFAVPKAGHLSNLENPQAFNERLKEFLEKRL